MFFFDSFIRSLSEFTMKIVEFIILLSILLSGGVFFVSLSYVVADLFCHLLFDKKGDKDG